MILILANNYYNILQFDYDPKNNTWRRIGGLVPTSSQAEYILDNGTGSKNVFEDKGYISFSLNLEPLHLPDQFIMYFVQFVKYLNNGEICVLRDSTSQMSIPPPSYFISMSPSSVQNIRPGDERDVQVRIRSSTSLPFLLYLSSIPVPGLEISFTPNKTSGIRSDVTTSNLHIKAMSEALARSYTIPIYANISLTPFNTRDPTPAFAIIRNINYTTVVLPLLSWMQQISEGWAGFGPAGVGGVIGGWLLKNFKNKKDENK